MRHRPAARRARNMPSPWQPTAQRERWMWSDFSDSPFCVLRDDSPPRADLVRTRGVVAIDDVLHAKHGEDVRRGCARVDGQPQPLPGLVRRTLHGDAPEIRYGRVDLVEIRVNVADRRGGV